MNNMNEEPIRGQKGRNRSLIRDLDSLIIQLQVCHKGLIELKEWQSYDRCLVRLVIRVERDRTVALLQRSMQCI